MGSLCHIVVYYNILCKVFLVKYRVWPITDLCAYDQVFKGENAMFLLYVHKLGL